MNRAMAADWYHKMDKPLREYAQKRREEAGPPMKMPPGTHAALHAQIERMLREGASEPEAPGEAWSPLATLWRRVLIGGAGVALVLIAGGVWLKIQDAEDIRMASVREQSLDLFAESARPGAPAVQETAAGGFGGGGAIDGLGVVQDEILARRGRSDAPGERSFGVRQIATVDLAATAPSEAGPLAVAEMYSNAPRWQIQLPEPAVADAKVAVAAGVSTRAHQVTPPASAQPEPSQLADAPVLALRTSRTETRLQFGAASAGDVPSETSLVRQFGRPAQPEPAARPLALATPQPSAKAPESIAPGRVVSANNLHFQQVEPATRYRRNLNSPPVPNVLPTFEVQQIGTNVRIVDWDESVYEGSIEAAPTVAQVAPVPEQAVQSFNFQATGTNRTLRQRVVFTGNFASPAGGLVAEQEGQAAITMTRTAGDQIVVHPALANQAAGNAAISNILPRARIEGNAIIGDNNLRIEAYQFNP
ncbi:MAG: hypothetical protein AB9869_18410 [Verrucomicrobiia bacterium]